MLKKFNILFGLLFIFWMQIKAQESLDQAAYYGISFNQITTGSGHGSGLTGSFLVQKGRKTIEAGFIYKALENRLGGGDVKYKIALGSDFSPEGKKLFKTYLQYNIIYQTAIVTSPTIVNVNDQKVTLPDDGPGIIATMEHYVSFGAKVRVFERAYLDTNVGLGAYIGSLDKEKSPGTLGIHKANYGFTYSVKIGFSYVFNHASSERSM